MYIIFIFILLGDDIKPCPRCQVLIVKMDDGSCNHMMCAVCGAEFCWLCMKEISDLHYLRWEIEMKKKNYIQISIINFNKFQFISINFNKPYLLLLFFKCNVKVKQYYIFNFINFLIVVEILKSCRKLVYVVMYRK